MTLRALIFDVDGTLADTEEAHRQAFNRAFAEHGLDWHWSASRYRELLDVAGGRERLLHYVEALDLPAAEAGRLRSRLPQIHESKTRHYCELVAGGAVPLRPGIAALLLAAERAGLQLAIATTTTPANVTALLAAAYGAEPPPPFSVIVAGDMVPHMKPAPDVYLETLRRLQLKAAECLAVEDSWNGLAAATAAGLRCLVTPNPWTAHQDFGGAWRRLDALVDEQGEPVLTIDDLRRALDERPAGDGIPTER